MLSWLGFLMVAVFMYLIMTKRLSAIVALVIVPIVFALIGGFGFAELGEMALDGIKKIAPTGVMLLFAILYFGIMIDAGLFEPLINKILRLVKGDPVKIVIGTAVLSMLVALDGDGTTTYIITVSAMLPLYRRVGINLMILTVIPMLSMGVMNMTPWGGPTARAISALHLDTSQVFTPLIPAMLFGLAWVIFVAYLFGKKERKRLGIADITFTDEDQKAFEEQLAIAEHLGYRRPKLLWFNALLTIGLMVGLVMNVLPLTILFILAFCLAVAVNYPNLDDQKKRMASHAANAQAVVAMVFAAGIFTGIITGTKMVDAMATSLVALIPESMGAHLPVIVAITSMPFTYFMSNDAYYFGVLPILAQTAATYGIDPAQIARASILGQPVHVLSPLYAAAYLLCGMVGVDFGENQKFILKWAVGTSLALIFGALVTGALIL
ncbi:CitMHS family transporter [Brevibacillus dissolubilis]|uniref:CitMHS family transporter n=1 Tax=Brevibacillus dissolubilis TaxID=1844116 RepID=UPI001117A7A4|nr:CitMHS family transporter [Brevibacillus dissolubilis]